MKKSILLGLGACALALGGVAALVGQKGAVETKADGTTVLYVNEFDGGGAWANFSYYMFNSKSGLESGWQSFSPSMKTKTPNEYDQYQYVLEVPSTYDKIVLRGNPSNWGGSEAQTEDLAIADMTGNGIACGSQKSGSNKFYVGYYTYSTKSIYMLDLKGDVFDTSHYCHTFATGKTGTTWPGVEMEKVLGTNNLYKVEINSVLNNVIFNNIGSGSNQTATISSVADGNVYIVYPDNGYNTLSGSNALNAAKFIDGYMKFETAWTDNNGTGKCLSEDWYGDAKEQFTDVLSDGERSLVLTHEPTTARFAAWAKAKGETFNQATGAFSAAKVELMSTETGADNAPLTAFFVTVAAVAALGGSYFFLKKRREN